ncbi:uncharacterized protein LOC119694332 [Plutella xylostella]|nr:uncharacterized protein LOC119692289 [Plutella xylostella]XP_048484710.1 uncharacterized protein LOC119694332 [Plutella xylostella]
MSFIGNIPIFDISQDWKIFKSRLEQFVKLNKIEAGDKSAVLLTHLSDEAYRLARNLVYPSELEATTYENLVKKLDDHFTPKRSSFADRAKFYGASKGDGESVETWAARLRGLAVYCDFGSELDTLLRDKFVLGMNDGPERDRLFEMDLATTTLAKALEVAQQAACARQAKAVLVKQEPVYRMAAGNSGRGHGASGSGSHFEARQADGARSVNQRRCTLCGLKSHSEEKCRYKGYKCQKCGAKGHLKRMCSDKKVNNLHNLCSEGSAVMEDQDDHDCKECNLFNLRVSN